MHTLASLVLKNRFSRITICRYVKKKHYFYCVVMPQKIVSRLSLSFFMNLSVKIRMAMYFLKCPLRRELLPHITMYLCNLFFIVARTLFLIFFLQFSVYLTRFSNTLFNILGRVDVRHQRVDVRGYFKFTWRRGCHAVLLSRSSGVADKYL